MSFRFFKFSIVLISSLISISAMASNFVETDYYEIVTTDSQTLNANAELSVDVDGLNVREEGAYLLGETESGSQQAVEKQTYTFTKPIGTVSIRIADFSWASESNFTQNNRASLRVNGSPYQMKSDNITGHFGDFSIDSYGRLKPDVFNLSCNSPNGFLGCGEVEYIIDDIPEGVTSFEITHTDLEPNNWGSLGSLYTVRVKDYLGDDDTGGTDDNCTDRDLDTFCADEDIDDTNPCAPNFFNLTCLFANIAKPIVCLFFPFFSTCNADVALKSWDVSDSIAKNDSLNIKDASESHTRDENSIIIESKDLLLA